MRTKITFMLAFAALCTANYTKAQTNTFPATGNVGIGTTAPGSKLDIKSANANALSIRAYGTAAGNTGQLQFKELAANGSNHIAFKAPDALASNYVFKLPVNYGTNGQVLSTNGNGTLSWTTVSGGGSGASTSLNNLVTTSINQSLIPSADNTRDLGTAAKGWRNIYASGDYYLGGSRVLSVTGSGNTFAGITGSTGVNNTFIGSSAGFSNAGGYGNVAIGRDAFANNSTGNINVAIGQAALANNSGSQNTVAGYASLTNNAGGYNNTAFGFQALLNTANSNNNVAIGAGAGRPYNNGWNNTFIGAESGVAGGGYFNVVAIGQGATVYQSNEALIGNTATISIGGYVNWSNFSDGRYKKDVKENVKGLDFIMKLRPVTYHWDVTGLSERANESRGKEECEQMKLARAEKEKMVQTGFIAQEVEAAAKSVGFDFSGVDAPGNEKDLYALRYAEFVVPLVKAVQELNIHNAELVKKIELIQSVLTTGQQQRLSELQITKASLEQNQPNPFNQSTAIKYFIPENFSNAQIKIYSAQGVEMKAYTIKQSGKGEITVEANSLVAGIYTYTLIVDDNAADVKQMIVTK